VSKLGLRAVLTGAAGPGYVAVVTDRPRPSALRPYVGAGRVLFGTGETSRAGEQLRTIGVDAAAGVVVTDEAVLRFALVDPVREEVFGAVLAVGQMPEIEARITSVNASRFGLAAAVSPMTSARR
jgi:hypothetical protein